MLINLSNHPSDKWTEKQKQTGIEGYGRIKDMPFPQIDPKADSEEIKKLAANYVEKCMAEFELDHIPVARQADNEAVHVMGELTFVYAFVNAAAAKNIACVASTTRRSVVEEIDGRKTSVFEFVQFRAYRSEHETPF